MDGVMAAVPMERAVEVAVLLLVPWPLLRLLVARPFHERLAAHPGRLTVVVGGVVGWLAAVGLLAVGPAWALRVAAGGAVLAAHPGRLTVVVAGVVGWLAGVGLLAVGPPWALRVAAGGAVVAALAMWWHARPGYGAGRGLPPGSLAFTRLGMVEDDRFLLREAARHGPVFKTARYGRPIVCVMGLRRGADVLREAGDALASGALPFSRLIPGGFIRYMAPADNMRYRGLLGRALPNELVQGAVPLVAAAAVRAFGRLADAGGASPVPYLRDLTNEAMVGLMFGIGPLDPRAGRMRDLYRLVEMPALARSGMARARTAMAELTALADGAAREALRRRDEGAAPACALDMLARDEPAALADATLIGNLVYLVETGGRDVADLLTWCLKMLADHPEWRDRLAVAARGQGANDLAARIVAETLRLEQSEYVVRRAVRPVRIGAYRVPAGWLVRLCVRESHRDPDLFPQPDRFDPDRFLGQRFGAAAYAPLGIGAHSCLGRAIVQVTAPTALVVLARDYAWQPVDDGPREFGAFHWMPSRRFAIRLERVRAAAA